MAWVGRDLEVHLIPTPLLVGTFNYTRSLKAPSSLALNTSSDGISTTSLSNLFQCLTRLMAVRALPCVSAYANPWLIMNKQVLVLWEAAYVNSGACLQNQSTVCMTPVMKLAEQLMAVDRESGGIVLKLQKGETAGLGRTSPGALICHF